jgi:hypothetical protein
MLSTISRLALADFRERARRYSFLITLLGTFFFGFLVITGKYTIRLGEYRGEYNSAWVGSLMASSCTIMMVFIGFYLIKTSLSRDRHTGVGEILASTSLGRLAYMAGKFISNLAVLGSLVSVLLGAAVVMQFLGGAHARFNLWALAAPFLFVCAPALTLVAAAALVFESVKWLRGTIGNVLYLFLAEAAIMVGVFANVPLLDFTGLGAFVPSMQQAARAAYPGAELGIEVGFVGFAEGGTASQMKLFSWNGIAWSLGMIPTRLLWVGIAFGLVWLATVNFDRFDPAVAVRTMRKRAGRRSKAPTEDAGRTRDASVEYGQMASVKAGFSFARMVSAELRLMLKGYHWSWYVIAAGLLALQFALPYEYARTYALAAAWVWPLALWSSMGTRETRFGTDQLLFSSPYPLSRQFFAVWGAGLAAALVAGSGILIRAAIHGNAGQIGAILVAALFVTTLALALGTTSGSKKLFEVVYLMIWYIGPVNRLPQLDFLGTSRLTSSDAPTEVFLAVSLALASIAFLRRRRMLAD